MFMYDVVEMAQRHGRILARLSELGLAHAERLHEQAMVAPDAKSAAEFGLTFHRVSRSIRQSIALEAKLVRDAQAAERRDRAAVAAVDTFRAEVDPFADLPRDPRRIDQRKADIREPVLKAIHNEVEREDPEHADYLTDLLEQRLELFGRSNGFGLEPLEQHLARFYADFDLRGPAGAGDYDGEELEFDAAPPLEPWPPPDST